MKRSAKKGHMTSDRLYHRQDLQIVWFTTAWKIEAERSSFAAPSLISGWISVFAKTPHRGCNRIKRFIILWHIRSDLWHLSARRVRHLVNKRTCTTGTYAVHSLFDISAFKIDDLSILAAQARWQHLSEEPSSEGK